MKKDFPFMPLEYKKLESHEPVQLMTLAQYGAYMKLIIKCWHTGSIPSELDAISRLINYSGDNFKKEIWDGIKMCFVLKAGRFHQTTVDEKKAELIEKQARLSEAGKRGALIKRSHSHPTSHPSATQQGWLKQPKPQPKPYINNQPKVSGNAGAGGFCLFTKKEENRIRAEIAKTLGFAIDSEAVTQNFIHVLEETESATGVKNKVAYAIGIARKLKK